MFNSGMVLFVILIMVRVPYINSYVYLFEKATSNFGGRSAYDKDPVYPFVEAVAVLGGQVAGAAAAAALRVTLDVSYGRELHGLGSPNVRHGLSTDVAALRAYDSYWKPDTRVACFKDMGRVNGTVTKWFPLTQASRDFCVPYQSVSFWYLTEEAVYVLIVCMVYVHIWQLTSKRVERYEGQGATDPQGRRYWETLFKLCFVLCFLNVAMTRAFPTAHGSLHKSLYYFFVDEWTPGESKVIDDVHDEMVWRVMGGVLGGLMGVLYGRTIGSTIEVRATANDASNNLYHLVYCFVWGMAPPLADVTTVDANKGGKGGDGGGAVGSIYRPQQHGGSDFKLRIPYSLM
jgi:hypothetical protein